MDNIRFSRFNRFFKNLYAINQAWFKARKLDWSQENEDMVSHMMDEVSQTLTNIYEVLNEVQREGQSRLYQGEEQPNG